MGEDSETLRTRILEEDPSRFLRWDVIRRTMFVGSTPFTRTELTSLGTDSAWRRRWAPAIAEDRFGHPSTLPRYRASSGNRVHHAYHIREFERTTGIAVESLDCVFEFGGGYGGMAHLLRRLGFRGRHIILDLPIFSALQRFYLATVMPQEAHHVVCVDKASKVESLLTGTRRLMIATWSLSEVPLEVRESVAPAVRECDHFLLAFQDRFEELDNSKLGEMLQRLGPDGTIWTEWPIGHLPGNRYLMGQPGRR